MDSLSKTNGRAGVQQDASNLWPLILITSLFFLWAMGVHFNDILIPYLKRSFGLTDFESSLVQTAFFGGYFLAALPASRTMERFGYKRGLMLGLLLCASGTLLFLPAASAHVYGLFLAALFVMACGQSFLEVASNPYIALLGPPGGAAKRLTIAQGFNAVGAVLTPFVGSMVILARSEHLRTQHAGADIPLSGAARLQNPEAEIFRVPYLVMTVVYIAVTVLIAMTALPEVKPLPETDPLKVTAGSKSRGDSRFRGLLHHRHLIWGIVAQFFYVGAQVGAASFVIRVTQHVLPGTLDSVASVYLKYHLVGFMLGRFAGSALMIRLRPALLLGAFAMGALLCSLLIVFGHGMFPVWAIVLLGACNSIMFPTIFALSLGGLGDDTKLASSLLVMAIIGGAVLPAGMGYISDRAGIQVAFLVPLTAYCFVLYFAVSGHRPRTSTPHPNAAPDRGTLTV